MARLVDSNIRNSSPNTYGRSLNNVQERPINRIQVVKAYGTVNSTGVCPDGSTCTTAVTPTEVEFTLNIYRRGKDYTGEVYIVNYDTRRKINSNQLIYYQEHDGRYILCIFSVNDNIGNCTYELIINLTPSGCNTSGTIQAYVAPIYSQGFNVGGPLTAGEVIFCDECQRYSNTGPICNPLSYAEQIGVESTSYPCVGPAIGAHAEVNYNDDTCSNCGCKNG